MKTRLHRARALLREDLFERAGLSARSVFSFQGDQCDQIVTAVLGRLGVPVVH